LVSCLNDNNRAEEAVTLLTEHLSKNPTDKEARYVLINSLTLAAKYDEVAKEVSNILLYDKKDIQAYRLLSRSFYTQGNYTMSLVTAREANGLIQEDQPETLKDEKGSPIVGADGNPKSGKVGDAGIWNNMGVTYLAIEDEPEALSAFRSAIEADSLHKEANMNLGYIYLKSGNHQKAKVCFESVLQTSAKSLDAKIGLAVALRGDKDLKGAEKIYSDLLKSSRKTPIIYYNSATFYEKYRKDYKTAKKILQDYQVIDSMDEMVAQRLVRVEESQRLEEERIREEQQKKKEAEEREKRQQKAFADLKVQTAAARTDYKALESCASAEEGLMEVDMYLEQVEDLISSGEADIAGDALPFVQEAQATMEVLKAECAGEAAPQEDGAEPDTESTEPAPE
jgi:Flp pilus assembly protein TadD